MYEVEIEQGIYVQYTIVCENVDTPLGSHKHKSIDIIKAYYCGNHGDYEITLTEDQEANISESIFLNLED